MDAGKPRPARSRQGLSEYVLVTAFFALAAVGAVAVFGDEIRAAFGVSAAAPGRPAPPAAPGR